jgi:hypothetical protein
MLGLSAIAMKQAKHIEDQVATAFSSSRNTFPEIPGDAGRLFEKENRYMRGKKPEMNGFWHPDGHFEVSNHPCCR